MQELALLYVRVSSKEQEKEGYSLDAQKILELSKRLYSLYIRVNYEGNPTRNTFREIYNRRFGKDAKHGEVT